MSKARTTGKSKTRGRTRSRTATGVKPTRKSTKDAPDRRMRRGAPGPSAGERDGGRREQPPVK